MRPAPLSPNGVRTALARDGLAFGTWVQTRSPEAAHAAAASGHDFVVVDLQHGSISISDAPDLFLAVVAGGASPVVRVPSGDRALIGQVLDAGAHGVLVPDLRSAAEARAVVAATAYAPAGTRGACPTVAATAHGALAWPDYRAWTQTELVVWGLVETPEAVEDVEGIAASGLDALVLGPFDLSMAMGLDGNVDHPDVVAAMQRTLDAASAAGIDCVAVLFETDAAAVEAAARRWVERGCRIVTALSDRWCLSAGWATAMSGLDRLRAPAS